MTLVRRIWRKRGPIGLRAVAGLTDVPLRLQDHFALLWGLLLDDGECKLQGPFLF